MAKPSPPAVKKSSPRKPGSKTDVQKVWNWDHLHLCIFLLTITLLISACLGFFLYLFVMLDIPGIQSLSSYQPPATSLLLDDRKQVVGRFFEQNRYVVPVSRMPELLPKAFIAAEDGRFYQHKGIDAWSILRAFIHNLKAGGKAQGGSTITQQVARSLLLSPEKTYTRKFKEAVLAYRINKVLSKEEIIHLYLNQIYLGEGAYGVEAAAQTYFDKHVEDLNLSEISLLAGLPQAPSRYSPFRNYKLAKGRQMYVLNRMAEEAYVTPEAARQAYNSSLFWASSNKDNNADNGYFVQQVSNYVEQKYGAEILNTGGISVYTSLNQPLQKIAQQAVQKGVADWQKRNGQSDGDMPQVALIAIEVESGRVKAMVGGTDFSESQFNRAIQARRQPGSAFKPIIYATALAEGETPATIIVDEPLVLQGISAQETWEPRNFSGEFYGPTTLRTALINSRNIVTIKLLQRLGIAKVLEKAQQMGITSPLAPNLSLALGASGVSLLELTSAYTVLGNGGKYNPPFFIEKIVDRHGKVIERQAESPRQVVDQVTAYQTISLLKGVIEEGTGRRVRGIGIPVAGKTGTTDLNMDAWFIGLTPKLAVGVWMGFDQKISLGAAETGSVAAAPVWLDFMERARKQMSGERKSLLAGEDFVVPDGVVFRPMSDAVGQVEGLASDQSWEAFNENNLPVPHRLLAEDANDNSDPK
ncbi:MAG: penicillin-binding protein 1A [Proteobacteria bacterium]|nr:penicillin-binding protein 1A [Pseudomonadota bacterium]MBU1717060.1 penicillin-binding protein 1A [Pseudomonadota bacterium]